MQENFFKNRESEETPNNNNSKNKSDSQPLYKGFMIDQYFKKIIIEDLLFFNQIIGEFVQNKHAQELEAMQQNLN